MMNTVRFSEELQYAARRHVNEREYWLNKLQGDWLPTTIPPDYKYGSGQISFNTSGFSLSEPVCRKLTGMSNGSDYTLHVILITVLTVLLHNYTDNRDIIVGTTIYRQEGDIDFINTVLTLRSAIEAKMTGRQLIMQVKQTVVEAMENYSFPMEVLADELNLRPLTPRNPIGLFDVAMLLENIQDAAHLHPVRPNIIFLFRRSREGISGHVEFNSHLYEKTTIVRMTEHFNNLAAAVLFNVDRDIAMAEMLSGPERERLLHDFNNTQSAPPAKKTVPAWFEEQVSGTPDRWAIFGPDAGVSLTYQTLQEKSNRLAGLLRQKGVHVGEIVGVLSEPSVEMVTAMLGILKAGGAYLPLDPWFPEHRLSYMLCDSAVNIVLTRNLALAHDVFGGEMIDIGAGEIDEGESIDTYPESSPGNCAYVIYTSGTTGKPKGVAVTNSNLVNYVKWFSTAARITSKDKTMLISSFAFDLGYTAIYSALLNGAELHLLRRESYLQPEVLINYIEAQRISYIKLTPSLFSVLVNSTHFSLTAATLSLVVLGGEEINVKDVERAHQICPRLKVMNHYGPTEATIGSVAQFVDFDGFEQYKQIPTIGNPIDNTRVYILTKGSQIKLNPAGKTGELCISGEGLARGYINKPEFTAAKFVSNTYKPGQRIYRTGDLARWRWDGKIEFLGRCDHQVKIRGFRIELAEIEAQLLKIDGVKEAAVVVRTDTDEDKYLSAYIVDGVKGNTPLKHEKIRAHLSRKLPDYMIPSFFVCLEKLPLTSNGKLDRRKLPEPELYVTGDHALPRDGIERRLAALWADLLKIEADKISIDANFFGLGGQSLKATILASKIHKEFDVRVPLIEIFKTPSIREISEYIREADRDLFSSITVSEEREYYRLSSAQKRLYVLQQMDLESTVYNRPHRFQLDRAVDREKLEQVFRQLIRRHESLRTSFEMIKEEPVQVIHRQVEFNIEYHEAIKFNSAEEVEGAKIDLNKIFNHIVRPFDLTRAPLLRVGLVKCGEQHNLLLMDMHHIISDGVSQTLLAGEFRALYSGDGLPLLRLQYRDYALWQSGTRQQNLVREQATYWLQTFDGEIPVLNLPTDYSRPLIQSFEGGRVSFTLAEAASRRLKEMAGQQGVTLFMSILSVFTVLLSKLSGQTDIVVGTPTAGRRHPDLEGIVGMFVNTLALRNYPGPDLSFGEFLKEVSRRTLAAFDNQEYQFEDLVEQLSLRRDTGRNPLFDVMFNLLNQREFSEGIHPGNEERSHRHQAGVAKFDLTLTAADLGRTLFFSFEYCTKLFKAPTIDRFIEYFKNLVILLADNPACSIAEIEIITEAEKRQILVDFNSTDRVFPQDLTLHRLFSNQATVTPETVALVYNDTNLTYRQLDESSDRISAVLRLKGAGATVPVAVMVERSLEMVAGIVGILKSGAAYVPVDPEYPAARIRFMLKDCGTDWVVSRKSFINRIEDQWGFIDLEDPDKRGEVSGDPEEKESSPRDPAYVMYTSGSTGEPKGVVVEHIGCMNILSTLHERYSSGQAATYLFKTSYTFDVSVTELFGWYWGGGRLVILERDGEKDPQLILASIDRYQVSHINFVPSMFNLFVDTLNSADLVKLSGLRYIFLAGEALSGELAVRFRRLETGIALENIYGPTEATVYAAGYSLSDWDGLSRIPIGRPLSNTKLYILDRLGHLQPVGVAGELCISGAGVARGYLGRDTLTAERFTDNPFVEPGSEVGFYGRLYRTGDLARWLGDGDIEFLGRLDSQVKIRGFRIELGEIENHLLGHEGIREAVVLAGEASGQDRYLAAYVVPVSGAGGEEASWAEDLREYLAERLPDYMIPSYFVELAGIPLTSSGKIDRKELPEPRFSTGTAHVAPRNEIEEKLAEIWSSVLGIEKNIISVDANFFAMGGHSLKATGLLSRIHKQLNVRLTLAQVFKTPTVRGLAVNIQGSKEARYAAIQPSENKEYYNLSSSQKRLFILQQMEPAQVVYNMPQILPLSGEVTPIVLERVLAALINRHESLRTSFHMLGDEPVQRIHGDVEFEIEYREPSAAGIQQNVDRDENGDIDFTGGLVQPFDLSSAPLLRVVLIGGESSQPRFFIDIHHIISDGISQSILADDFKALYSGEDLPQLRLQYKDYARWQSGTKQQNLIREQESYWLRTFSDEIPVLNLPTDFPRPLVQSFKGNRLGFTLSEEESRQLKAMAAQEGVTLFMSILSVLTVLLSKLSGQDDIVVGSPVAGRRSPDLERIVGMFVNTLALRNFPSGAKRFAEFIREVRDRSLAAFENQGYQFEDLVEKLSVSRDTGRNPLFDVMFNVLNQREYRDDSPRLDETKPRQHRPGISKFDLTLTAVEREEKVFCMFEYSSILFKPDTIDRIVVYFKQILNSISGRTNLRISELEIITEREKHKILNEFNDSGIEYPGEKTIQALFEVRVDQLPHHIALECEDKQITYKRLNRISNRLAGLLRRKGVGPNGIVALLADRSIEAIIGMLGTLKAGGGYLPIDPHYPTLRKRYILGDSDASVLLMNRKGVDDINNTPADLPGGRLLFLDDQELNSGGEANLDPVNISEDLAYIIYTSGTTGRPRGVMIEHRSLVNFINSMTHFYGNDFDPGDRCLSLTNFCFDVSVCEIFMPLNWGARIILLAYSKIFDPDALADTISSRLITFTYIPPGLLRVVWERLESSGTRLVLSKMLVGVEPIKDNILEAYLKLNPRMQIINGYGPTEATICATAFRYHSHRPEGRRVPIGIPLGNTEVYLLDRDNHLVPVGIPGELSISGVGLSRGYLGNEELNAEKFVSHPFKKNDRLYKTGDMARWLADGNILFIGRVDDQVKIRGFRVELGEVESQLLTHKSINAVVVLARETGKTDNAIAKQYQLCAYLVSDNDLAFSDLQEYLALKLPDYMIPSYFIQIPHIPLTANGKVDKRALPEPEAKTDIIINLPRDGVEMKVARLWSELLGIEVDRIGINDNFFELGGHSLRATVLISRLYQTLNVKIPLVEIFKSPTIRQLSEYIKTRSVVKYSSIRAVEKRDYYLLSSSQKRLFILQQLESAHVGYNMPQVLPLSGEIDPARLERAFTALINRHESLRTSFHLVDNEPVQRVSGTINFEIEHQRTLTDGIEGSCDSGRKKALSPVLPLAKPFDLSIAPLLRVVLVGDESSLSRLFVDMHHIISDGVSQAILASEFRALYSGERLPWLRLQYRDYALWQSGTRQQNQVREQAAYWLQTFDDEIPVLNLPTDYSRPLIQSFEGGRVGFTLAEAESRRLKEMAGQHGVTLFMSILSVFTVLLSKLSGQADIVVGTPTAGRRHPDLEGIVGMFVNTLALRNYPGPDLSFGEFLKEVSRRTLAAFDNQEYPFEELVEQLSVRRDTGRNPLFDVMFNLLNQREFSEGIHPGNEERSHRHQAGVAKFDLTLTAADLGRTLFFSFEYCTKLFKASTIDRFIGYFKNLVNVLADNPASSIAEITIITEAEKRQILVDFNSTDRVFPQDQTLHWLFSSQAAEIPQSVALVCNDTSLTYRQLDESSDRIAAALRLKGVGSTVPVAVVVERSLGMAAGIIGILKSGAFYVPIDPAYPSARIRFILQDCGSAWVFGRRSFFDRIEAPCGFIDVEDAGMPGEARCEPGEEESSPRDPAYVIYTSGSTGEPKGVVVEHIGCVNILSTLHERYSSGQAATYLFKTSYTFDVSVTELFGWYWGGGRLAILERDGEKDPQLIVESIARYQVTHINFVPSMFNVFVDALTNAALVKLSGLRFIFLAGEALSGELADRFRRLETGIVLENIYGPTEATIYASGYSLSDWDGLSRIPIGRPLSNMKLYILDCVGHLQPVGVAGELCIAGAGVARGYLGRETLTAERFTDNPFVEPGSEVGFYGRLYRTGDLARWLGDGHIEFLGRLDSQVKIRGFRIELGEIENHLLGHEGIREAVVSAGEDSGGDRYLAAYVVPVSGAGGEEASWVEDLREYLSEQLPEYMIPSYFVELAGIPLTSSGKIDRKKLPEPRFSTGTAHVAPRNEIEEKLAEIWSSVLGIEKNIISVDANFFALGGHSLKGTILVMKIQGEFGVYMPLLDIFKRPSIEKQADIIRDNRTEPEKARVEENLVLLKGERTGIDKLFLIHDGTGEVEGYTEFCSKLDPLWNCWGIRSDRMTGYGPMNLTIESVASRYIEKLQKVQPLGPYRILGWSLGGTIAFEMVRQLEQMNEEVEFLAMVDAVPPVQNNKSPDPFSLETEMAVMAQYLSVDQAIINRFQISENVDHLWSMLVKHFQADSPASKRAREAISRDRSYGIPGKEHLAIDALIRYFNRVRSLRRAWAAYIPGRKISAPILFFKATFSGQIKHERWRRYSVNDIQIHEIKGDHFSIFKNPEVINFVSRFQEIAAEIRKNKAI